ncbi:MAG TPA: M28 family peptidase [Candidatus Thermoplasmatota archaeon]|nr:M28 family peptidase [Candidatus Thermoplasmatota archaeon]
MRRLALVLVVLLLAGCTSAPAPAALVERPGELRVGSAVLHNGGVQGGLSLLHLGEGGPASVAFPDGVLVLDRDGRLVPPDGPVTIARGELVQYLAPYGASELVVQVDGAPVTLPLAAGRAFVDGQLAVELLKVQRERFPHRTPHMPNFEASVSYFADYFEALGYKVEVFRPPVPELPLPLDAPLAPQSLVSVVATKRGTTQADRYLAFGGHFDVVEQTTEGAFDNTAGTVATLAMAKAFAQVNTSHSLIFGVWGGEEDGILGSQAWLAGHPELVPFLDLYVNFDVTSLAWPAPAPDPAPVVATTGPDGPMGDALAAAHQAIVADWMQVDAPFVYEPVAQGQANGAGVNAQSDHTSFLARGIPVLFQFTARTGDAFALIHSERDTTENMTKFALRGPDADLDAPLNTTEQAEGEAVLAKSFETQMVAGFYLAVLMDDGVFRGPKPAEDKSRP